MTALEAEHQLILELTLAFYTRSYIRKHAVEWDTAEKYAAATDPALIRERWRAQVGTHRFDAYLSRATAVIQTLKDNPELVQVLLANLAEK